LRISPGRCGAKVWLGGALVTLTGNGNKVKSVSGAVSNGFNPSNRFNASKPHVQTGEQQPKMHRCAYAGGGTGGGWCPAGGR